MNTSKRCDGVIRRDVIRVGGLTALGLGMGGFLQTRRCQAALMQNSESHTPPIVAKAKSCILIWLDGGPSHLELFDPKPDAPSEVRGPLGSIPTNIPGVRIGECFERTSQMMDKFAIVPSMTSPLGEHNFGAHYVMTGYKPSPALKHPTIGSTLAHTRSTSGFLPPYISVPQFPDKVSGNGFLPSETSPFSVGGNPDRADFKVRDLDFYQGLDLERLDRRRNVVRALDAFAREKDASSTNAYNPDLERAYQLIASSDAKKAFQLSDESDATRSRYGRGGGNGVGQCCLLARRLVERGVPFVTVNSSGWDTHQNIVNLKERYPNDRNAHLPSLDRALSALVGDLSDRGMLDETLVLVMGEFGRTPKINANGGRDHWPNCFSVAMAGGGIRGGQVYGKSDALGEFPEDSPVTPSDMAATIYTLLGIDPAMELHTSDGRPVRVSPPESSVLKQLIG